MIMSREHRESVVTYKGVKLSVIWDLNENYTHAEQGITLLEVYFFGSEFRVFMSTEQYGSILELVIESLKLHKVEVHFRYNDEKDFEQHRVEAETPTEALTKVLKIYENTGVKVFKTIMINN